MKKVLRKDKIMLQVRGQKPQVGFTLMELLLAITLFAIIAVAIYSSMAMGVKLHRRGENLAGKYNDLRFAFNRIAQDLRTAIKINEVYMVCESQRIYFYSIQPAPGGQKEINKITYTWARPNDFFVLTRLKEKYIDSVQDEHTAGDELLTGISQIDFSYGYLKAGLSGAKEFKWKGEWKNEALPKLVRLKVKSKGEEFNKLIYCPAGKMGDFKE